MNSIKYGISMNIAGGTHHAFTNRAEAFCILNDQAIAANFLINRLRSENIVFAFIDGSYIEVIVDQISRSVVIAYLNFRLLGLSMLGQTDAPHALLGFLVPWR